MTIAFLRTINEYIIDSIMDADRKDIEDAIGTPGYPTQSDIDRMKNHVANTVQSVKTAQLVEKRAAFESHKLSLEGRSSQEINQLRSVTDMLSDIVTAINNRNTVPEGLLVAFREQGYEGDDEDIKKIWQDLVDLGLIQPRDTRNNNS